MAETKGWHTFSINVIIQAYIRNVPLTMYHFKAKWRKSSFNWKWVRFRANLRPFEVLEQRTMVWSAGRIDEAGLYWFILYGSILPGQSTLTGVTQGEIYPAQPFGGAIRKWTCGLVYTKHVSWLRAVHSNRHSNSIAEHNYFNPPDRHLMAIDGSLPSIDPHSKESEWLWIVGGPNWTFHLLIAFDVPLPSLILISFPQKWMAVDNWWTKSDFSSETLELLILGFDNSCHFVHQEVTGDF